MIPVACIAAAISLVQSSSVPAPVNTVAPEVSLDTPPGKVGTTASTTDGTWTGAVSFTYQWWRNDSPIGGATSATYTLVVADADQAISCVVTATGPGGSTQQASFNNVSPAELAVPVNSVAPSIALGVAGTNYQSMLLDLPGIWSDGNPVAQTAVYQWQSSSNGSDWTDESGANSSFFNANTENYYYRLGLSYTSAAGTSAVVYSNSLQFIP